jgi:hypothetical protein
MQHCTTSAFEDEPRRMLRIIQRFGKHFSCQLQGEYLMVGQPTNQKANLGLSLAQVQDIVPC